MLMGNHSGAWFDLGRAAREAGAMETARMAFEKAIALGRDDGDVHLEIAMVLHQLGEPDAAIEHAERALQRSLHLHPPSWIHMTLASCYRDLGDTDRESQHGHRAVELDPENPEAQYNLGLFYQRTGNLSEAIGRYERAASLAPEKADDWYALGVASHDAKNLKRAKEALTQAQALKPEDAEICIQLVRVHQSLQEDDEAIELAKGGLKVAEDPPSRSTLHQLLALSWSKLGNPEAALLHFQEAVKADPEESAAHFDLGVEYWERDDFAAAIPPLERAVVLAPEDTEYRLTLARAYAAVKDFPRAEPLLRSLLEGDQREVAHLLLERCSIQQSRFEEALQYARDEVDRHPESAVAWAAHGWALAAAGEEHGAKRAWKKAQELDPGNSWVEWAISEGTENEAPE
jgi:tetratricopeptide (TPR) repeat protein